ncbi:glycine zipper 2TM domain-containing protein [Novosphingobium sp. FKTRR1]|uniref:glycine zipper 2TM domain-containing protein n=1 Tax=Novosphingobium sp. FKTRR1 TaxID=2879118 RepID=UPI001CEFF20A|nr:glycine zipper 2TM domain-containing protein [Novosphingobium sp. FKTRR1]
MTRLFTRLIATSLLLASGQPVLAQDNAAPPAPVAGPGTWQGSWQGGSWQGQWIPGAAGYPSGSYPYGGYPYANYPSGAYQTAESDPRYREMEERCRDYGRRGNGGGVGGAVIGGVAGGVLGNRIAPGDRTLGTVAGAAIGALAGAAIDKSESRRRQRARDRECDEFYARTSGAGYPQTPGYGQAYPGYAPAYGFPVGYVPMGYVMVPVQPVQAMTAPQQPCTETKTVTYEYVTVPTRKMWRRAPIRHDKRVKEKRVYMGS